MMGYDTPQDVQRHALVATGLIQQILTPTATLAEMQALRAEGVSERRIAALYPVTLHEPVPPLVQMLLNQPQSWLAKALLAHHPTSLWRDLPVELHDYNVLPHHLLVDLELRSVQRNLYFLCAPALILAQGDLGQLGADAQEEDEWMRTYPHTGPGEALRQCARLSEAADLLSATLRYVHDRLQAPTFKERWQLRRHLRTTRTGVKSVPLF